MYKDKKPVRIIDKMAEGIIKWCNSLSDKEIEQLREVKDAKTTVLANIMFEAQRMA